MIRKDREGTYSMRTHRRMYVYTRSTLMRYIRPRVGLASRMGLRAQLSVVPKRVASRGTRFAVVLRPLQVKLYIILGWKLL